MSSRATVASISGRALGSNASWPFSVRATQDANRVRLSCSESARRPAKASASGRLGPVELLSGPVDLEVFLADIDGAESIVVDTHGRTVRESRPP